MLLCIRYIEAGTLHAIGKGILIAEIQQNSNTTYRVYDYGRVGADGKPRALHIDKALDVTTLSRPEREPKPQGSPVQKDGYTETLLAECEYFTTHALDIKTEAALEAGQDSFHSLLVLEGGAILCWDNGLSGEIALQKGDSVFIPAGMGCYRIKGNCSLLFTTIS